MSAPAAMDAKLNTYPIKIAIVQDHGKGTTSIRVYGTLPAHTVTLEQMRNWHSGFGGVREIVDRIPDTEMEKINSGTRAEYEAWLDAWFTAATAQLTALGAINVRRER